MSDTIMFDGQSIKMSYGLLNVLCRLVGEVDGAAVMTMDNDIREQVLIEILSPRTPDGVISQAINLFTLTAPTSEVAALLDWAQEQVVDFFVNRVTKTVTTTKLLAKTVEDLKGTLTGGQS